MEYINIITKEPITAVPNQLGLIVLAIASAIVLSSLVYWFIVKDEDKTFKYLLVVGFSAIVFTLIACCVLTRFFSEPTGRYKYKATVDKDNITVAQYEEFIEKYNPTIKDGIYYWEE